MSNAANWKPSHVLSGTFGTVWWDGELVFEAKAFEATIEMQMEAVKQAGKLADGQKMLGYSGTGTLRTHKVFSRAMAKLTNSIKAGLNPEYVAAEMDYKDVTAMEDAIHQAKATRGSNHRRHLVATLKASQAKRLMRKGIPPIKAAERAGYSRVDSMWRAIRLYTKSPAPTGIGNEADLNHQ
jgi:hypothetical protein